MPPDKSSIITSRQNPLLKELQPIRDDRKSPLLFLEGPRLIQEAITAKFALEMLILDDKFPETAFLAPLRKSSRRVFVVSDDVFRIVSDVDNPQGLLAIARKPAWTWEHIEKRKGLILILDGIQDPGNASTIIRTAEAAGAAGLVTTPGTARLFSPKALRGAAGSTLRLPVLEHRTPEEIAARLKKMKYTLVSTSIRAEDKKAVVPYTKITWKTPHAVVLGQEGRGVSAAMKALVVKSIFIPMQPPVDSLNVAATAAIILYESACQR